MSLGINYAGRYKPYDHQRETTEFLIEHPRAFCFNDIGTGKTLSALWAMDHLLRTGRINRCLIIAPKSTLDHVWGRELFGTFHHLKYAVLNKTADKRRKAVMDMSNQVLVINPDGLPIIADTPGINAVDLVIIDESTAFKTWNTRRHKTLRDKILKDNTRVWMMSGSPMPQAPTDIWAQARVICPDAVPRTFGRFRDRVMIKVTQFKWVPKPNAEQMIAEMIKDYTIRFDRDDCLDLPPAVFVEDHVDPSEDLTKLLTELRNEAAADVGDGHIEALNEGVHVSKMLQAGCGAVNYYNDEGEASVRWVNCTPKFERLQEIIDEAEGPVIVFSPFIQPLHLLRVKFKEYASAVVYGATGSRARAEAFDKVQNNEIKLLLAQPDAMAHGITLTRSNTVVWWGLPFKNETYEQACGRIIRSGQTRKQLVHHLLATPMERIVLKRLRSNAAMQGALLELLQS